MNIKILSLLTVGGMLFIASCGGSASKKESDSDPVQMENVESTVEDSDIEPTIDENVMESTAEEPSSVSSADIDEALDSFEKMVDKIDKIATKLSKNDLSVIGEYTSLISDLEDYEKKVNNFKGEMTPNQLQRFTKLTDRMVSASTKAAAAMSKASTGTLENLESLENLINF